MSRSRVITGAMIVAGSVFASGLLAGGAAAQYEPVGKPLQLLPPSYTGKSAATPRSRVAAKKAAKSETKPDTKSETKSAAKSEIKVETKAETKQHVSFRRKHRQHIDVAEQKRPQRLAAAPGADTPVAPRPAPVSPATASPPPSQAATGELVVGGQAVQVRSPDEANEIDLAANEPTAPASAPAGEAAAPASRALLYNMASTNPPVASDTAATGIAPPAPQADPAPTAAVSPPKSPVGSVSWIMQIMAAIGGAVAAGSAAWFLIGSASSRIKLSEWQEADGE